MITASEVSKKPGAVQASGRSQPRTSTEPPNSTPGMSRYQRVFARAALGDQCRAIELFEDFIATYPADDDLPPFEPHGAAGRAEAAVL